MGIYSSHVSAEKVAVRVWQVIEKVKTEVSVRGTWLLTKLHDMLRGLYNLAAALINGVADIKAVIEHWATQELADLWSMSNKLTRFIWAEKADPDGCVITQKEWAAFIQLRDGVTSRCRFVTAK